MGFRRAVLGALASLLLVTSCGGGGDGGGTDGSEPASASLPLQSRGLAIGGDEQTQATDVVEFQITEDEAREIGRLCEATVEVAPSDDCTEGLGRIIRRGRLPCRPHLCLRLKVYNIANGGVIEVADDRPDSSLCDSGPANVCLRVGLKTAALRNQILGTESATTSTTEGTTPPSTSTDTSSETSSATSSPSTPELTSAPTTSP